MKKIISFALIIIIILNFCGCNTSSKTNTDLDLKKQEYAKLLIEKGVGLQEGQKLLIESEVENYEFARLCEKIAYDNGAADVLIHWTDSESDKMQYQYADDSAFSEYSSVKDAVYQKAADENMQHLRLMSSYPGILDDVDSDLVARGNIAKGEGYKSFYTIRHSGNMQWSVGNVANEYWANFLFPDLEADEALNKLWDIIFTSAYVTGDGKAAERWDEHLESITKYSDKLNSLKIKSMHYVNSIGTDITVEFSEDTIWNLAKSYTLGNILYSPNIPSEEIYTAPMASKINGTIVTSMPLEKNGSIIKDIKFTVKDGKIIESSASEGLDLLNTYLDTDEGARYFGEISLVPFDSPISNQNILLYNTLFDENASCHMAFGFAYNDCIKDGEYMTEEQLKEAGLNSSSIHIDVMMGTNDLNITAETYDGRQITVFENGNFAEGFLDL